MKVFILFLQFARFCSILLLAICCFANATPVPVQPGCFQKFQAGFKNRAITAQCKNFANQYLSLLDQLSNDPVQTQKLIVKELELNSRQGVSQSYLWILFSVLTENQFAIPVMKKLAEREIAAKVTFPYAVKALERIQNGKCKPPVYSNFYEICYGEDQLVSRFVAGGVKK